MSKQYMAPEQITLYGTEWCPDSKRSKYYFIKNGIQHRYVDIDQDPEAENFVKEVNQGFRSIPTIAFPDGSILVEPTNAQLAEKISLLTC